MQNDQRQRFVTLLLDLRFLPESADQGVELLVSNVGRTEAEPGWLECLVECDPTEKGHLRYSETWETEAAFQRHLRSVEFRRVLVAMEMCREEPQVTIGDLSGRKGMAYLEKLYGSLGRNPE